MWAVAAVMAVGALAQYYNAEKARGASQDQLKKVSDLYDKIKPPNYDLKIQDPPELHAEALKRPEFSDPMQAPSFDSSKLQPEDLKLLGKYVPEVAPFVAEAAPQLVQRTATGTAALDAQKKALERYTRISDTGNDPVYQAEQQAAARRAQTEAQSRQASILQDFARRGQSGSGLNLAAQLGGTADAMDREASAANQSSADAYTRRLQALGQGASLAGDIGRDDTSMQSRNADIINSFNDRTSRSRQAWEQSRAGAMSDANRFNTTMGQDIANSNVQARNAAAVRERNRLDELSKYGADFSRNERDRVDANSKWNYGADVAQRDQANNIALQKAKWQQGERNTSNDMLSRIYNDQLQKTGLSAGILNQVGQAGVQRAQDQNAAIGGLTSAYGAYGAGQDARSQNQYQQTRADDRAQYQDTGEWMTPEERKKRSGGNDPYEY